MTTKISIIDVNLGSDISNIIADDLNEITTKNKADIDAVIEESKRLGKIRDNKEKTTKAQSEKTTKALEAILAADNKGDTVASKDLLLMVAPEINNMNSLAQRLRSLLKTNGDNRKLTSLRQGKDSYYYLTAADE